MYLGLSWLFTDEVGVCTLCCVTLDFCWLKYKVESLYEILVHCVQLPNKNILLIVTFDLRKTKYFITINNHFIKIPHNGLKLQHDEVIHSET